MAVSFVDANKTVTWSYDDDCTNECGDTDNRYWCGKHRTDPEGYISHCVQYTKYGEVCVNECGGKKDYNWCLTNAYRLDGYEDYWGYCSLAGFTVNKEKCWDNCEMRDENYFWCHKFTDKTNWDYCSPPGLVKPVEIHRKGGQCITECGKHGESYYWCAKSMEYCNDNGCDDDWEYCSIDEMHTRYGAECKERCSLGGESYYWCHTVDGSWDYCSPKATEGVHVSMEIELTRYGVKCRSVCKMAGEDYFWCEQIGGSIWNWWDYCSPQKLTINNAPCTDECARRGNNYHWCHTKDSWDYCSPQNSDEFGYTSIEAGAPITASYAASVLLLLLFIWAI